MRETLRSSICEKLGRRQAVPVLYVTGSHYDIGFDVGRTFSSLINSFIASCDRLRTFEKEYKTEAGHHAYEKTLNNMLERYPFYVKEIQGVADGAKVPFHLLFLLQMDDIIETINENSVIRNDTGGCSSIGFNSAKTAYLGHTEDAFEETLNHFYILSAHVVPTSEDRQKGAVEERFASLCYAGQMPGYTMGYNGNGLVFSINTLSPRFLKPGSTPRTFITRRLLAAKDFSDAERILQDEGMGAANGFSLNMLWTTSTGSRTLYNVEIAPDLRADRSRIDVNKYETGGEHLMHCNKYMRLQTPEVRGPIIDSSNARLTAIRIHGQPKDRSNLADILSDTSGQDYQLFSAKEDAIIKTIAAGIFDMEKMTWSIYIQKPNASEPVAVLPVSFPMLQ